MVTVAVDASVRYASGSASWAAVLRAHDGRPLLRLRGRLETADSCHAELVAVARLARAVYGTSTINRGVA